MLRFKELREEHHLSQQALADILHVTQQSIHKYEHDLTEPDLDILLAAAKYFDTSADYLVGYTNVPMKYEQYDVEHSLNASELRLINYYRSLSPTGQTLLLELIPKNIPNIIQ